MPRRPTPLAAAAQSILVALDAQGFFGASAPPYTQVERVLRVGLSRGMLFALADRDWSTAALGRSDLGPHFAQHLAEAIAYIAAHPLTDEDARDAD